MDLPKLADVTELSPYVTRILGQNPGPWCLQGTNTYLVGGQESNERILIDAGEDKPAYSLVLEAHIKRTKLKIVAIVLTHWHRDHCGGLERVLEMLPNKDVVVYKYPSLRDKRDFSPLRDTQTLTVAGAQLTIMHTPGHTEDHVCLWLEPEKTLFSGDNVLGHGSSFFTSYTDYLSSLRRMQALQDLTRIYPSHGEVIPNGKQVIGGYIEHRIRREVQVLEILDRDKRPMSSEEITRTLYSQAPDNVLEKARVVVEQYLDKLVGDGRVRSEGDVWVSIGARL